MSRTETLTLSLGDRPVVDVQVAVERVFLAPVEPGEVARVEYELRKATDVCPLELREDGEVLRLRTPMGPGGLKRVTLFVPPHVKARVVADFGRLHVRGLLGCDLDLSCSTGEIELEQVRGRFKVVVNSGVVRGEHLAGTFDVTSMAGAVKLAIDALDPGEHAVRTSMGSVKLALAPEVVVRLESHTNLGSARLAHPSTPDARAVLKLAADLGAIKVKTGNAFDDPRNGDWPDWRRLWRDVSESISNAFDGPDVVTTPPAAATTPAAPPRVPEAELRKVLELVEAGKLSAPDAERLIRAMGA